MMKRLETKLNMFEAVCGQCREHPTTVAIVKAFENSSKQLKSVVTEIHECSQLFETSAAGYAANKKALKEKMVDLAMQHSSAVFALATITNNLELRGKVSFPKSRLTKERDSDVRDTCKMVAELANDNMVALGDYGITAATIAGLEEAIDNYLKVIPTPRIERSHRKVAAARIVALLKEGDNILKNEMDKTVLMLKADYGRFVSEYFWNRKIVDAHTSSTALNGVVKSSATGEPVKAKIVIAEMNETRLTNGEGFFEFKPIKFNKYTLKVEAVDGSYETKIVEGVQMRLGKTVHVVVELEGGLVAGGGGE